jgi:hypothetical protein
MYITKTSIKMIFRAMGALLESWCWHGTVNALELRDFILKEKRDSVFPVDYIQDVLELLQQRGLVKNRTIGRSGSFVYTFKGKFKYFLGEVRKI